MKQVSSSTDLSQDPPHSDADSDNGTANILNMSPMSQDDLRSYIRADLGNLQEQSNGHHVHNDLVSLLSGASSLRALLETGDWDNAEDMEDELAPHPTTNLQPCACAISASVLETLEVSADDDALPELDLGSSASTWSQ